MDATFAEAAQECSVPSDFASTVLTAFSVATFARVASTRESSEAVFAELLVEGHLDSAPASERIQALASLRLLFNRCRSEEQLASLEAPLAPDTGLPAAASTAPPSVGLGWHESWPAKLTAEAVSKLREDFESSYPTELLDQDSFPSSRLLALASRVQTSKEVRWIPWKFRLSSRAQDDHLLLRPKKTPRLSELSDLPLDEAPTREFHSGPVSHNLLSQLLSLKAVALSLVKACHLGSIKIYNRKFIRLCFPRFEAGSGLRGPSMEEAQQADKRAWEVIADLCNLHQWTLDNALYEVTEVRSELSALLAPRPALPKLPPAPHLNSPFRARGRGGKGRGGKEGGKDGKGRSNPGKGQGQKSASVPGGKWLSTLYEAGQKKTICMRFQTEEGCATM